MIAFVGLEPGRMDASWRQWLALPRVANHCHETLELESNPSWHAPRAGFLVLARVQVSLDGNALDQVQARAFAPNRKALPAGSVPALVALPISDRDPKVPPKGVKRLVQAAVTEMIAKAVNKVQGIDDERLAEIQADLAELREAELQLSGALSRVGTAGLDIDLEGKRAVERELVILRREILLVSDRLDAELAVRERAAESVGGVKVPRVFSAEWRLV